MKDTKRAISIENLTKTYGDLKAINGITFHIDRGDFFAFLGPNGAGKTTTLHAITGLANYQEGIVRVFGYDVMREYRRSRPYIGLCSQEFNFDPFLNIEQLLIYQGGYFGIPKRKAREYAMALLERFQLIDKRRKEYRVLSGGMKRRLLICRALMHDPEILILDEPTAGADLELKYFIWEYLRELNKKGKTIVLTTHYMEEAERLSQKIAILHRGNIVALGEKFEVLGDRSLENVFLELTQMD